MLLVVSVVIFYLCFVFVLVIGRPTICTRPDTPFTYTAVFRSEWRRCVCRDEGRRPEERQTHPRKRLFFWNGAFGDVTCQVAPPLEGEMRCPGDISTIIR